MYLFLLSTTRRHTALFLQALIVLVANLIKERTENNGGTQTGLDRNGMTKNNGRNANGKHLSRRHDDGKDDWSKLFNGPKNAQLTTGRCNGGDDIVPQRERIGL
jgi:hypothetical protein